MGLFDRFKKTSKESLLGYLKNSISDNSSLEHIVSVFEEMCNMPLKEDMILFETGTYSFTGKPMFNFSLVRQFPNDEEEYYQIHVDVLYIPTEENKDFQRTIWNEDIEEDIFSYIKKTPESITACTEQKIDQTSKWKQVVTYQEIFQIQYSGTFSERHKSTPYIKSENTRHGKYRHNHDIDDYSLFPAASGQINGKG